MAGQQRLQILEVTGEPYVCCGGMIPCCCLGEPQDKCCVALEACCCPSLAVAGNRFLIQTRFDRHNTACDDCLLWFTCLCSWAVCIAECAGCDVPEGIENAVDCLKIAVDGCMLAQQQVEIDFVQKMGYTGPNPAIMGLLPPVQQQMMAQARPPAPGPMGIAGVVAGAAVGGAPGAAVMYGGPQMHPPPQAGMYPPPGAVMYPPPGQQAMPPPGYNY